MANTIQLKRRLAGNAGAPAALRSGEVAHNEVDDTLYVGKGDDGAGNATAVIPLAGKGAFVDLTGPQSITGAKTFATVPKSTEGATGATDLVRKSQFDAGLAGRATLSHAHAIGEVTGLQAALDAKVGLASPALTGTPTAPTAAADTNSTQLATTAFVLGQVAATTPAMDGTAAVGTAPRFARADHVHPTDTSRAPLASPAFTGTPTAPTAASGTNTTQIATTGFVRATRLDQLAAPAADLGLGGCRLTGLGDPQGAQDAVTKGGSRFRGRWLPSVVLQSCPDCASCHRWIGHRSSRHGARTEPSTRHKGAQGAAPHPPAGSANSSSHAHQYSRLGC